MEGNQGQHATVLALNGRECAKRRLNSVGPQHPVLALLQPEPSGSSALELVQLMMLASAVFADGSVCKSSTTFMM